MNTVEEFKENIEYILENWIPIGCVTRVHEGGGPEDLNMSLAVSLSKMMDFYQVPYSHQVRMKVALKMGLATIEEPLSKFPPMAESIK